MKSVRILVVILCIFHFFTTLRAENPEPFEPVKTTIPPEIDGRLDEPVWQETIQLTGFKTFTPDFGLPMQERTIAYVTYDEENLYFAFRCFDTEPDRIKTSVAQRDRIGADDWVCINLDSFNDQQGLYAFYINPSGIQMDSRFAGGQEDPDADFVWYSKGVLLDDGYTIEVRIPFKSIRYSNKDKVEMGVIFERRISRISTQGTFPPLDPDKGFFFLTQMQPFYLYGIKHYRLFEILPAVTHSRRSNHEEGKLVTTDKDFDFSLTSKLGITPELILDATYNPDFSQVEADAGQIDENLRYALFYPEKRSFFLDGREHLNFAGTSEGDPLVAIIHTRQIVDPLTGIKLSGKLSKKNRISAIYALDELPEDTTETGNPYAHFSIFRYKRSLREDSYIGAIYTGRDLSKSYNRVFGIDGMIRITKSSVIGFHDFLSTTKKSLVPSVETGNAFGIDYLYNTRNLDISGGIQDLSNDFETEIGYMTRRGLTRARFFVRPKFYPKTESIRRIFLMLESSVIKDKPSGYYETDNTLMTSIQLKRTTVITLGGGYSNEIFLSERFITSGGFGIIRSQITKQFYIYGLYRRGFLIRYVSDPYSGYGNNARAT
ncbi:MAG: carbohydrate binding family 9 domain-containing protein, partial [Bacteroidales bacterium]